MPRINQYSENATIENDDKVLTYDTQAAATKITPFSTIWNWIVSKLHALTSSGAALTPSTDRVIMDKNGTMTRVEPAAVAKYGIETYNGSTIAGSAQTVKSALDTLNSKSYNLTDISNTIPQNGNLNDYTTCGNYKLTYDSYASSISNCPVSVAFVLRVESTTGEANNYIKQVLIPRSSDQIWQRTFFETWSSWLCIPTRAEFTALSNAVNSKFATVSGTHTFSCNAQTFTDAGAEPISAPTGFTTNNIISIDAYVGGAYWARCIASRANNNSAVAFMIWNNTAITDGTIYYKITFMKE